MLSQNTIDTIKATIPALSEHGVTLTRHFYDKLFTNNPEVIPFFNPSNQIDGRQQKALAGAIIAFAQNIDNLSALNNAVELIAQKHASLMIKPEHYPIVGENLLISIKDVLGDAANKDIMEAWADAYGFLADILAKREAQIYAENASQPNGWEGFRLFNVIKKVKESSLVTSFYLSPIDGKKLPAFRPGQYLTVRVPTANGSTTMRNYSLSDCPGLDYYRISVKREAGKPNGIVSTYLHTILNSGDTLEVAPPCGEFFLNPVTDERALVLLAGGIGITPLLSMISETIQSDKKQETILIHACQDEKVQAFKETLDSLCENNSNLKLHYRYAMPIDTLDPKNRSISEGFIDEGLLNTMVENRDADYYICGPNAFMDNMTDILDGWNIDSKNIHTESFGPKT